MKHLLVTLILAFTFCLSFGQMKDTLVVPLGTYGYIKIGDKVYKIDISLNESKPNLYLGSTGTLQIPNGTYTPYTLLSQGGMIAYDTTLPEPKKQKSIRK